MDCIVQESQKVGHDCIFFQLLIYLPYHVPVW